MLTTLSIGDLPQAGLAAGDREGRGATAESPRLEAHLCLPGTSCFVARADIKVLQGMLGYASPALTLDRYGHLLPGQAQSVADRLDEMARKANPRRTHP